MSTTIYDSPDEAPEQISIDITSELVWFFQHYRDEKDSENNRAPPYVVVNKRELPAIYEAIRMYLKEIE